MDEQGVRLVCFELCGEQFAFNMDHLVEIVQVYDADITSCVTPVPLVRGIWNYRQTPLYVVDLREFFGLTPQTQDQATSDRVQHQAPEGAFDESATPRKPIAKSMVVVKIQDQMFGLLTDIVLQVIPLGVFYEYPDLISTLPRRYFAGVSRVNSILVLVLALENFLTTYEIETLMAYPEIKKD